MVKAKTLESIIDDHGSYSGIEKGCFGLKDREGKVEKYRCPSPISARYKSRGGNAVSSDALPACGFWERATGIEKDTSESLGE